MITNSLTAWHFERANDHVVTVLDPCVTTPIELHLHSTDRRVRSYYNLVTDILGSRSVEHANKASVVDDDMLLRQALQALERYSRWAADIETEMSAANVISNLKCRLTPVQTPGRAGAA